MRVTRLSEAHAASHVPLPLFLERVTAGFPSPAQDHMERQLDLNELCVRHPAATYLVVAQGDSMLEAGIHPGDILIVDRAVEPVHGHIVIAELNGELTVKRLELQPVPRLVPCNPRYRCIELGEGMELAVMGVVVHSIRNHCPGQGGV